jgi:cyanophycin synthetase
MPDLLEKPLYTGWRIVVHDVRVPAQIRWRLERARARTIQVARMARVARSPSTYVWDRVLEHRSCWSMAANAIGAELVPLSETVWEVRRGDRRTRIANHRVQLDDPVVLEIAGDKELTSRIAADAGVRIPEYVVVDAADVEAAWRFLVSIGRPVVVKPARGTSAGIGVTIAVETRSQLIRALAMAGVHSRRVMVQRMLAGESCRLLFLDGRLIDAVRRRGVRVKADGRSSVAELISSTARGRRAPDRIGGAFLRASALDPLSIPPVDAALLVRPVPEAERRSDELRTIYDEDITDLVGAALVEAGARLVRAIGSSWAGVDIVTPDVTRSLEDADGGVVEVNTTPGILHHCLDSRIPCMVAMRVLERLLEGVDHLRPGPLDDNVVALKQR